MPLSFVCVLATGCAGTHPTRTSDRPHQGGTVYLLTESNGFTHLDPQLNYTTMALNVGRLIYRTLTAFRTSPRHPGGVLRPDLATDLGRASDGNRTWEFTLRAGAAWEDGGPVTCDQLRYGVARSFTSYARTGPVYPRDLLVGVAGYRGTRGGRPVRGLPSVTCLSSRTVQFRLNRPCGDFDEVVAMPVFAPVRPDVDARGNYDRWPMSDGPYRIVVHDGQKLVLARNRYWRRDTDPVRPAYPDRYVVRFGTDPVASTAALVNDTGRARRWVQLDFAVPPNFVQQVINQPVLMARTVSGRTGAVRFLAVNTRTVADLRCRRALSYALDKQAYRTVVGGAVVGDYASTMIPPSMPAHRTFDLYRTRQAPQGDVDRAVRLVDEAGDCPSELTLDVQDVPTYRRAAQSVAVSYQRIGIRVVLNPIPKSRFYDVVSDPRLEHDLVLAAWVPDWPNGSSIIPALFDGGLLRAHATAGNYNFSLLSDPRIDRMIRQAQIADDDQRQYVLWGAIDQAVSRQAATVPILYERGLSMRGGRVGGAVMQSLYGEPDVLSLWVS